MKRETLLAGGVVAVVAAALLAAAVVPGAIAEPDPDPVRPGHLSIHEVAIAPGPVSGATATLEVDTRLAHSMGRSENVTVLVRAVHLDSGLIETTERANVSAIAGDREVSVRQNLSVERAGGYRIETIVYRDGERITERSKRVRGVGALTPDYARTGVGFRWRGDAGLPAIEYAVEDVRDNRTTLDVSTFLTNQGDGTSEQLRVVFTARQADSNVVADRVSVSVDPIRPGRTAAPSVQLAVPDGYNYYLDAVLWKDGVVVGTARSAANLNPTETIAANETVREVDIEVSDFERDEEKRRAAEEERRTDDDAEAGASGGVPGFTAGATLLALIGTMLLARRYA